MIDIVVVEWGVCRGERMRMRWKGWCVCVCVCGALVQSVYAVL